MLQKICKEIGPVDRPAAAPQLTLKTGLNAGQTLEDCLRVQDYWKKEYYSWYKQAADSGRI